MAISTKTESGNLFDKLIDKVKDAIAPATGFDAEKQGALLKASQYKIQRTPWLMWLRSSMTGEGSGAVAQDGIAWAVNPAEVSWSMPTRTTHSKNLYGTVLHTWLDDVRGTFFDEFRVSFKFQSGSILPTWIGGTVPKAFPNINPMPDSPVKQKVILGQNTGQTSGPASGQVIFKQAQQIIDQNSDIGANAGKLVGPEFTEEFTTSHGLKNLYDFFNLVDAPKLTLTGEVNTIYIQYNSKILPSITLIGMFDTDGIRWTDSAQDPHQVNSWTADFIVYDTQPRLSSQAKLPGDALLINNALLNQYFNIEINNNNTLKDFANAGKESGEQALNTAADLFK